MTTRKIDSPPPLRFSITEEASGRVIAVVEAADAGDALDRFQRVRHFVHEPYRGVLSVKEQDTDVPLTTPSFFEGFFQVLEASSATKH